MKLKNFSATFVAALTLGLLQGAAVAQLTNDIDADIPFSFTVGDQTMAAGKYVFHALDPDTMEIHSAAGKAAVVQAVIEAQKEFEPKESELVFQRFGKKEFLHQVFLEGNRYGVELEPSKAQLELEAKGQKGEMHSHPARIHMAATDKAKS